MNTRFLGVCTAIALALSAGAFANDQASPNTSQQSTKHAKPAKADAGKTDAGKTDAGKPVEYTPAQRLIFDTDHLKGLEASDTLNYGFDRQGSMDEPFTDKVAVSILGIDEKNKKNVSVDFLTGERHIDVNVFEGFKGNPALMMFLERDVKQMSEYTKGSTVYFRARIKDAFASPAKATITKTQISVGDAKADATVLVLEPYVGVPEIDRFRQFEHKTYQFVISDAVPGGIYSIRTVTPGGKDGAPALEESMTYQSKSKS